MTEQVTITEVRNARSMNAENTIMEVEINHPEHGWIPYLLTYWDEDNTVDNDAVMTLIGSDFEAYIPPTEEELFAKAAGQARIWRDEKLRDYVDPVVTNSLRWNSMSEDQQTSVANYRDALLAVPDQEGFPHDVVWPEIPEVLQ